MITTLRPLNKVLALGAVAILTGCASVQGGITNFAIGIVEDRIVPPILELNDVDMGCQFATSSFPLISGATRAFYGDPALLEALLYTTSAVCSEKQSVDEELRYLRATRANQVLEAQDARIIQKRLLEITAKRQFSAFKLMRSHLEEKYEFQYGEKCPVFKRDYDELTYILGTIAGLQAVINDIASQQMVGVPTDIAPLSERAMSCVSNTKWWGVPLAARAVVWNILPGGAEGKDVWGSFNRAMIIGERGGVRLAHVMYAISAQAGGDEMRFRDATKRWATATSFKPSNQYRLVEDISTLTMTNLSDRYWSEKTGTRTPIASIGKYWDESSSPVIDIDLENLLEP
jgi:hypothetical protein